MDEVDIKLEGGGLSFEGKIPLFQAVQILGVVTRPKVVDDVPDSEIEVLSPGGSGSDNPQAFESPKAAIVATGAKVNPQKIVALALFLGATSTNGKLFTLDDIRTQFVKAGEPTPKNMTRDFKKAVQAGFVVEETTGKYRLLSAVDSVVADGFKKHKLPKTTAKASTKPKPSKKTVTAIRAEVANLAIEAQLDGHIDFFALKTRPDRVLWILAYAKARSLDGLTRAELINLAGKLGENLTSQNFASTNDQNMKKVYIRIQGDMIQLSTRGEQHIKAVGAVDGEDSIGN